MMLLSAMVEAPFYLWLLSHEMRQPLFYLGWLMLTTLLTPSLPAPGNVRPPPVEARPDNRTRYRARVRFVRVFLAPYTATGHPDAQGQCPACPGLSQFSESGLRIGGSQIQGSSTSIHLSCVRVLRERRNAFCLASWSRPASL